ncbi:unnamed protein product [Gadus morhua 'NCC']
MPAISMPGISMPAAVTEVHQKAKKKSHAVGDMERRETQERSHSLSVVEPGPCHVHHLPQLDHPSGAQALDDIIMPQEVPLDELQPESYGKRTETAQKPLHPSSETQEALFLHILRPGQREAGEGGGGEHDGSNSSPGTPA